MERSQLKANSSRCYACGMQIRSGDANIFYEVLGKGPDLVLLHPFPLNHHIWDPIAERLATRYRVVLPDLRGHGDSDAGEGPATMAKHARDVMRVCEDAGVERAVFCGNSIGGYVIFELWRLQRERIRAMFLCGTKAGADNAEARGNRLKAAETVEREGPDQFIEGMLARLLGESTRRNRPDTIDRARNMMRRMTVAGISAVQRGMAERPDSIPTLATINVPALVAVGDEDVATPRSEAEVMARGIRGSRLTVVPGAGHYVPLERCEEVHRLLQGFLQSVD
jgi:3-oxoadipate enol-lactonase